MRLTLAPDTVRLAHDVRDWAVEKLRPIARKSDRNHAVSKEDLSVMDSAPIVGDPASGTLVPPLPTPGATSVDGRYVVSGTVVENGAYGDMLFMAIPRSGGIGFKVVELLGTPEQCKRWNSDEAHARFGNSGFGLTEPGSGSDAAGLRTTAVRDGDSWVINGSKMFCSLGAVAGIVVVFATVDRSLGSRGIRAFVVEKGTPGFEIVKANESKLGIRAMLTSQLAFDNVVVPLDHCLGTEESGPTSFRTALATLNTTRHQVAGMAVGVAQASLDGAADLLRGQRHAYTPARWGRIEDEIRDMNAALERGRFLARRAAWLLDQGRPHGVEASIAKAWNSPLAERVCSRVLSLLGPDGYSEEHLFEKWYRDVKIIDIWEGTGQIHRRIVSQHLMGNIAAA
jgi:acyl-CoA dehydrogenase